MLYNGDMCAVQSCPVEKNKGRGLCENHYKQWQRGTITVQGPRRRMTTDEERFVRYIEVTGFCWLWRGALDTNGYGVIRLARLERAHRWVYQTLVGPIPDGLDLDHLCRVRRCVNPDHLDPVTRKVNLRRGAGHGGVLSSAPASNGGSAGSGRQDQSAPR